MTTCSRKALTGLLASVLGGPLEAQERLVIDLDSGREIVNDWTYGFRPFVATNHEDALLFVFDASDPLVAMAISLDDGTVVGTYGLGEGEGPGELRQLTDVAATTDGVLVSDGTRINYWRLDGTLVGSYRPSARGAVSTWRICSLSDQPAVPMPGGILVRETNGSWEAIGPGQSRSGAYNGSSSTHFTCFGDVAYVLYESLWEYGLDGSDRRIPIPPEVEEASRRWRESIKPPAIPFPYSGVTHDGEGGVFVIAPRMGRGDVAGGIIDPATGCYQVIIDPDPRSRRLRRVEGMYRDSVIVTGTEVMERVINGVRTRVIDPSSTHMIALRPLRPDGGEPCTAKGGSGEVPD